MSSPPYQHHDRHRNHSMFSQAGQRLLRKCRSEKKLHISPPMHARKVSSVSTSSFSSDASTTASATSPIQHHHHSSISSHESSSSDWDPLRCHPPLDVDRSPYITMPAQRGSDHDDYDDDDEYDFQTPMAERDLDDIISHYGMTALRPPPPLVDRRPLFQRMRTADMDIHEGFDFGFVAATNEDGHRHHTHHLTSGTSHLRPLTSSTMASDHSSASWFNQTPDSKPSELMPSARSRRPQSTTPDTPAHLIRRGEWKRRGIVFVSEAAKVTEEDCFEIP